MHTRNFPLLRQLAAKRKMFFVSALLCLSLAGLASLSWLLSVRANNTAQTLPLSQNWGSANLITANDNWSGVPGIEGFFIRNDSSSTTAVDPQTLLGDTFAGSGASELDVVANQTNPNTLTSGGVAEFDGIANPTIALQGSGTADAPYVLLHLNTTGLSGINVAYNVRDIDGSTDNAVQPVALQYRVGNSGSFMNLAAGFVSDATTGPSLATQVTPISVNLPAGAENQPLVQVRIITTNAAGNDEWVGIDDISVTGSMTMQPTNPTGVGLANPTPLVAGNATLLTVTVTPGANPTSTDLAVSADLTSIGGSASQTFFDNGTNGDVTSGDNVFSYNATVPVNTAPGSKTLPFSISDAQMRAGSGNISLTIQAPPPLSDHVVISQIYGGGGNSGATYQNDYVELYNPSAMTFNLNGWSVQYASSNGTFGSSGTITPLAGSIGPGQYYLVKLASGGAVGLALPTANVEGITNMSASNGKVALVNNTEALTDGATPCTLGDPNLVDFVGFGTATCREGSANAPAGGNTTAILRNGNGATDTNQNANDFSTGNPNPRRTATIIDAPPSVSSTDTDSDAFASTPAPRDASVAVFFSEPVEVTGTWYDLTCANSGAHSTVVAAGPQNWVITPDVNFTPGEQCTFQIFAANVKDSDTDDSEPNTDFMQANYSTTFTVATAVPAPYDPSVHLALGNPSGAVNDTNQPNNYLLSKPEYAVSYNRDRGGPNWVSWHLSNDWTGSLTRVDTFRPDPQLPAAWNRVNQFDYSGSGFDRGHMTPSADRLASLPLNQATFLMDNIIPQAPDNNQITWNNMEQDLRLLTPANELYIIAGGAGTGGSGNNGPATTIAGGKITVPASTWKVALVIPKGENDIARVDCSARTIAVIVPNTNGTNSDWTTYLTTVDAVETLTGYDFFSNLPEPIQRCVEAGINGNNPPLDTDADGVPDSNDNCPLVSNANQANFDGDALGDACDPDDDNDGVLDTTDNCPFVANPNQLNTDGDSQGDVCDLDDDNDGVLDTADNCPLNFNSNQSNFDGDGLGDACDPDDDNDGVPDINDQCPNTPPNTLVNPNGCVSVTTACGVISGLQGLPITPVTLTGLGGAGGPYTFSAMGLPAGLMISMSGTISGTPTMTGTFPYTVTVQDKNLNTGLVNCSATIIASCSSITLAPATLSNGVTGAAYSQLLTALPAGGNFTFAVTTNALPPGLTLAPNGALTGTPTAAGNYSFVITATGFGTCTVTRSYNVLITGTCATITVNPTTLPSGTLGVAYNQTITATGGVAPYTFSVSSGALPTGLSLSSDGVLTGTPSVGGTYAFTLKAVGQGGCVGTRFYVVTVACAPLTFSGPLPNGAAGQNYSYTIGVTPAGTYSFSLQSGSLPPGYTLSNAGLLSGVTSQTGTYTFTVKAVRGSCQGTQSYTLIVGANRTALAQQGDYDGDGKADFALWSNNGTWRLSLSNGGANRLSQAQSWGQTGDASLFGDYDGDGQTDLAVFRPADGTWNVKRSSDGSALVKAWGLATDVPVPGDYDGDGKTDIAVFRPSDGHWYVLRSSDEQAEVTAWGAGYAPYNDVAVPGDYDGDGRTDLAVFRRSTGAWLVKQSSNAQYLFRHWGLGTDTPVAADYDGDGQTDIAVWRGTSWYIWQSTTNSARIVEWGASYAPYFDQALPGDYDGDGQADVAVWRASDRTWYVICSQDGSIKTQAQGQTTDSTIKIRQ